MRKIYLLFLIVMLVFTFVACKAEKVTLHCDGENCENTVEMTVGEDSKPDESWVVFCQDCASNVLED